MSTPQQPSPALVRAAMKDRDLTPEEKRAWKIECMESTIGETDDTVDRDILRAHITATVQAMREEADSTSGFDGEWTAETVAELINRLADRLEGKET